MSTKKFLKAYENFRRTSTPLFAGMFRTTQESFHDSEEVEIDLRDNGIGVSATFTDLSQSAKISLPDFSTKKWKPPVHREHFDIKSGNLMSRHFGNHDYADVKAKANMIKEFLRGMSFVESRVSRVIELQASQVLQTGKVSLQDQNGARSYTLDFGADTSLFASTADWSDKTEGASDPISDITAIVDKIREVSGYEADELYFGRHAWSNFVTHPAVKSYYDSRRVVQGAIRDPEKRGNGAKYNGTISINGYELHLYTYTSQYQNAAGETKDYLGKNKVVVRSSEARFDATFGNVPHIGKMLGVDKTPNILGLPKRFSRAGVGGYDLITRTWLSEDGSVLYGGAACRPLMVPTAINSFGCLTTKL